MMAEENKNADSYDGRDGDSRTVFVWGKTILVNIEGKIQKIIPQQYKTNMTGGRAGHATLPCEWGSKCLTVAASTKHGHAHRLSTPQKELTSWNGGGGTGGVHCGVAQERSSTSPHHPPTPTHVQGKINVAQARHLTSPILPQRTHQTWNGGGGTGGVHHGVAQEQH